ncbi:hypothetical protein ASPVEDRAFT_150152 [Aspergillus versicolor CBS 583.65]|uniref:Mitochondrial thiamine pyrophosphate carrier 1 n=1 Tax=Aspergillus versicolor CBS 583.65 TaxID=1036611 RepID=A0A1L9PIG2_ASPVE|nr:uncharacterized protein ASPVEDRAFT_150152 [Aspergillus versicolor CBS 583.65]OJJ01324.1 hypothetical protein ASPVEDRAFT_150152 [Aspergillus versicolor CBS 583.65]
MAESIAIADTPGVAKEFLVGTSGGITQVIIGQPFDIVKVRMQVQANKTAIQVARDIWKHEGALAFYKGTLPPLLGVGACISIVYSTFHTISQAIHSLNDNNPTPTLTPTQTYLAGGLSGLANSIISGPTEHIRIRLQTQSAPSLTPRHAPASGPYSVYGCIRAIHSHAGLRGLYRGQTPTMLREFGSYGVWFCVYEGLLSWLTWPSHPTSKLNTNTGTASNSAARREDLPTWQIASCGVITGLVLWSVNYPFDVVKSKMQADGFGAERRYVNMRDVVRRTWCVEGVRGFFRGLGPTLFRAVPVSGGTFVVVEQVRKLI